MAITNTYQSPGGFSDVRCLGEFQRDDDDDVSDDDVDDVYVLVGRYNDACINVQHGDVTSHRCVILLRQPAELSPALQCQSHSGFFAIRMF